MTKTSLTLMVLVGVVLSLVTAQAFLGTGDAPRAAQAAETAKPEKPEKPVKRSGKPENITFDDLNTDMPADIKWDAKYLTDRIKELDGKTVKIAGVMYPDVRTKGITEFVMLKNSECLFGPGGPAHHVIMTYLGPDESTRFTTRALTVEGVLLVKPWEGPDGNVWALFELRDGAMR
jgi:hypothetical protein